MMQVEITIGQYIITPHGNLPDGRCIITVERRDRQDAHDHWHGPEKTIDVDALFADEPPWGDAP